MELYFRTLATVAHVLAVILASAAAICLIYSIGPRRWLTTAAFTAAGLHLALMPIT